MDISPYVVQIRDQLLLAAETGSAEERAFTERLAVSLDAAARLALLEALSAAAAEITREIAPGSVDVRLRGRDPELVVQAPPLPPEEAAAVSSGLPAYPAAGDDANARINLRLPQDLKDRVESAARTGGVSVNTWLVRAAAAALAGPPAGPSRAAHRRGGETYSGWVR